MVEKKVRQGSKESKLIVILGPTASGKTKRAVSVARHLNAEIVSADSRQVYRDMNLGTGKDLEEYEEIPYHLIDICEAGEKYNLHRYISDFHAAISDIESRGKRIVVCGGSGMYLENALSGIRLPEVPANILLREKYKDFTLYELKDKLEQYKTLHNTTDVDSVKRAIRAIEIEEFYHNNPDLARLSRKKDSTPLPSVIIGIDIPRDKRRERISQRLKSRLENGMLEEVKDLINKGTPAEDLIYYGLEYKFLTLHILGKLTFENMSLQLETAIHQFAKRQMTWFRGMERRGFKINWLPFDLSEKEFLDEIENLTNG